ncbi:amino acid racemase [Thermotoga sp. Ku-13t]|uniref:aspartate/glutamate racemase family protein n=1 Tax=Thermotoga sp. Ku-13t TaxID=1755813 RepID=UPI001F4A0663|nr:amino acid racemase [Thermotoga sp. Ku-13t]
MKKVAGIVGGMGSLSTVDFLKKVVESTYAEKDQDHIRMIVDFNTQVPDRTTALLHNGEDPTPYLVDSVRRLQKAGADFALFVCNTAHAFLEKVQAQVDIPILNLPKLALEKLMETGIKSAWLTGTRGLIASEVYQKAAKELRFDLKIPDPFVQDSVMNVIYSVKAGRLQQAKQIWLEEVEPHLDGYVLLACTELPVVACSERVKLIDLNELWARMIVEMCGGRLK